MDKCNQIRRRALHTGVMAFAALVSAGALAQADNATRSAQAALDGWIQAFNLGEPTRRFFTPEATLVRGNGVFVGAERIDAMEQRESRAGLRLAVKVQRTERLAADSVWVLAEYELTVPGKDGAAAQVFPGVSVHVLQSQGGAWQTRVASFTRVQAPAPRAASALN